MDVTKDKNITAIQSLPHWVYNIQCLLWIVHDIELYVYIIDCELTVAIVHVTLRHCFTHVTAGQYFWLYTTLTVSEVVTVLLWHINSIKSYGLLASRNSTNYSLRDFP